MNRQTSRLLGLPMMALNVRMMIFPKKLNREKGKKTRKEKGKEKQKHSEPLSA